MNQSQTRKPRACKKCGSVFNMTASEIAEHNSDHDRRVVPVRGIQIASLGDLAGLETRAIKKLSGGANRR